MQASNGLAPRTRGGQLMTYGRSIGKALDYFHIDREVWPTLAADRAAWRDAIHGGLLDTERPKRASTAETNRRISASLAGASRPAPAPRAAPPPAPRPPPRPPPDDWTGRRVLVPSALWPDYVCNEHDGQGWEAKVVRVTRGWATIDFLFATDDHGRRYHRERLELWRLRPLPPPPARVLTDITNTHQ